MLDQSILSELELLQTQMTKDRRALHQIPEIGWTLPQTTAYLCSALEGMGFHVEHFLSRLLLTRIGSGPCTVLLRAEMDGLPVQENSALPFRSHTRNCHYSGHDLHMAMLLGIASVLKAHEAELPGQVIFLFQPAGEIGAGSKFAVERGFLEHYGVTEALTLHLNPSVPSGQLTYLSGPATASLDAFTLLIRGKGGRGYSPFEAVSPLEIAAHIQLVLGSLIQREVPLPQHAALSIGKAGGGTVSNQIPECATVEGTVRCTSEEVRQHLVTRIREIAVGMCAAYRGKCSVEYISTPALMNDPRLHSLLKPVLQQMEGVIKEPVFSAEPSMGAEGFAYISRCVPTAFFHLGAQVKGHPGEFDEDLLLPGAKVLLASLLAILNSPH